jgi:hypothetical protein
MTILLTFCKSIGIVKTEMNLAYYTQLGEKAHEL